MRTIIVIILTLTIPATTYIAGCRQDSTAAFPKSGELDSLAKARNDDPGAPPIIPPAVIDKNILNLPERDTMARINAVDDHSRQLAGSRPPAGLFTLPESGPSLAQGAPVNYQNAPAALTPIPSAREFWSKPAPTSGRAVSPIHLPADVSAMMPSQPQPVVAPPSAPQSAAPGFAPPPGMKLLPPEPVPGVFDGFTTSLNTGSPPLPATARFTAPGGDALGAPLPSSQPAMRERVRMTPRDTARHEPLKLDLGGIVGPGASVQPAASRFSPESGSVIVAQSIPGAPVYEPLPEPVPLEEYNRARGIGTLPSAAAAASDARLSLRPPVAARVEPATPAFIPSLDSASAAKSPIQALPLPDFKPESAAPVPTPLDPPAAANPRLATLLDSNAVREALAPLPSLAGNAVNAAPAAPVKAAAASRAVAETPAAPASVSLPPPMPALPPSPELTAAKTALLPIVPSLDEPAKTMRDVSSRDLFRMDLPEQRPSFADRDEPAASRKQSTPAVVPASAEKSSAPQKVKLTPIRSRQRSEELGKIDAATEVPPMRF